MNLFYLQNTLATPAKEAENKIIYNGAIYILKLCSYVDGKNIKYCKHIICLMVNIFILSVKRM